MLAYKNRCTVVGKSHEFPKPMTAALSACENHLHETEARWFAVYTRYKREKLVVKQLQQKGIECYLPLQRLTRRYDRKVKQVELPLINCYIFVRIVKGEYVPVLETQDVLQFVKFSRNLIAIPEVEIDLLRRVVGELEELEVNPSAYHPGDQVEVIGGQLTGLKGTLIEKRGQHRLIVALDTLGYELNMEVRLEDVIRVRGPRSNVQRQVTRV